VSENGPREGTRDLPRPGHEAGRRAVDDDSPAGVAYGSLSRSLRRRRAELAALVEAGATATTAAAAYQADHPLEPEVTLAEVESAAAEAKAMAGRNSSTTPPPTPSRVRKRDSRS
jgi:hypothetical protein